jgi:hypothetical protein
VIAEESETPAGGPPQRSERDLLAERRARRAAESGDTGLLRRAEAAEATVKTLETHLASLQQRLLDTEQSARRSAERLAERELQLRRVKQQEYAEQQLRIEAEQALEDANRRIAGIDGQGRALNELQQRVAELERRSIKLERAFDEERRARERGERALEQIRRSHSAMASMLGELRTVASSLRALAERGPAADAAAPSPMFSGPPASPRARVAPSAPEPSARLGVSSAPGSSGAAASVARREELAEALAIAVERLRARAEAEASGAAQEQEAASAPSATALAQADAPVTPAPTDAPDVPPAPPSPSISQTRPPATWPPTHKHSMSLIGRWRAARKHRRQSRQEQRRAP